MWKSLCFIMNDKETFFHFYEKKNRWFNRLMCLPNDIWNLRLFLMLHLIGVMGKSILSGMNH